MHPNKPVKPVINISYLEDKKITGTGVSNYKIDVSYFNESGTEMLTRTVNVDSQGKWEDGEIPEGVNESGYVTALQYINPSAKSDSVRWVFPPLSPKINPTSSGENVHPEGTGKSNYWIHMKVENPSGGGESDIFQVGEDGNWRSLNAIPNLPVNSKITVRQSKAEFDPEEKQSKPVTITVS